MPTNYYETPTSTIIARRLQRRQAGGTLANWPPQNAMRQRPPTRGQYRPNTTSTKAPYKIPKTAGRTLPSLSTTAVKKTEVRMPGLPRFNFLRGI